MDIFKERLNEIIQNEIIKQSDLAASIGIARQCITDYKSGKSVPSIQTLSALCRALDVSADYLLGLEDDFGSHTAAPMGDTGLSSEERKLLEVFRSLSPDMRDTLWSLLATWEPTKTMSPKKKA